MNLKFLSTLLALSVLFLSACKDNGTTIVDCNTLGCPEGSSCVEGVCVQDPDNSTVRLTENISADETWTADKTYILAGRITVLSGATLTIEPGTVIKGEAGSGATATALMVARGAKLIAEGTAQLPIIFTTVSDQITAADIAAGNYSSPNLLPIQNGLWGGLIVLGKAPISIEGDGTEIQIEGIPTSDANGLFGGNDASDNSGIIKYVSIRHGGANIGAGNEINGLTLGGVGSGTVIENVEIVANQDDGIEWFGGSVNVKNVVIWNAGDDALDTDMAWTGTVDNFVTITPGDASMELDGPEGNLAGTHTMQNGTVVASSDERGSNELIDLDDDSAVNLKNIHFMSINEGQQITSADAAAVTYENLTIDFTTGSLEDYLDAPVPSGIMAGGEPIANTSVFGWTWANEAGGLDGL